MFSQNGKISEKQLRCMLLSSVFAGGMFVLPYLSARLFGGAVVQGLLLFLVLAAGYTALLFLLAEHQEKNRLLAGVRLLRLFLRLTFYIVLCIAVLQEAQVPFLRGMDENSLWNAVMALPLLLVALYAAAPSHIQWGGKKRELSIEKQARISELIFPVLFVPFIVMLLFGLGEVDFDVFLPHGGVPFRSLLFSAYALLTFLLPVEQIVYLRPFVSRAEGEAPHRSVPWDGEINGTVAENGKDGRHRIPVSDCKAGDDLGQSTASRGKLHEGCRKQHTGFLKMMRGTYFRMTGILLLMPVLTLLIQGIYGLRGAGEEEMLTISIMRYIRLPFGVLERFDVLMVWFFMTGCFVLIMGTLYQMEIMLQKLFLSIRRSRMAALSLLAAWLLAVCLPSYRQTLAGFLGYGVFVDIPLSLLLPFIELQMGRQRKWKGSRPVACLLLLAGAASVLTGCQADPVARNDMRNVEERDYATILIASGGVDGHAYHFDLGIARERRVGEKSNIEAVSGWDCDDLRALAREYQKVKGKDLSLSHLKVILWEGRDTVLTKELMEFLALLDENEEVAKTCPFLEIGDREELLGYLRESEAPVGSYVEQVIRAGERQEKNIPWLSDYLKAVREEQGVETYVLESVPEGFFVKRHTYLFSR